MLRQKQAICVAYNFDEMIARKVGHAGYRTNQTSKISNIAKNMP